MRIPQQLAWCLSPYASTGPLAFSLLACCLFLATIQAPQLCAQTAADHAGPPQPTPTVRITLSGDREIAEQIQQYPAWRQELETATGITTERVEQARRALEQHLRATGYVFAGVTADASRLAEGQANFHIDTGRQGKISIHGNRWYSADQILRDIHWQSGLSLNYRDFYDNLYNLNLNPDVTADVEFTPTQTADGQRALDADVQVHDRLPLHLTIGLSNTGTRETSDWRLRTTLEHRNLTHHNDVLTLDYVTDPKETDMVNAVSASYLRPLDDTTELLVYGGWSESQVNDVVAGFDVLGKGQFAGLRLSKVVYSTDQYTIDAGLGWLYVDIESDDDLLGPLLGNRDYVLSMPMFVLGYTDRRLDGLGGRTFVSNTVLGQSEGFLGASDQDDFADNFGVDFADGSFIIDRLQVVRLQTLPGMEEPERRWRILAKADAQYSPDRLVPTVQKAIGGADSVRGYREREFYGDRGIDGSIELQTPFLRNLLFGCSRDRTADQPAHDPDGNGDRLQFVAFYDFGYTERNEPAVGEDRSQVIHSVGAGFRYSISRYFYLKFDYGFPLKQTEDSDSNGRGHVAVAAHF